MNDNLSHADIKGTNYFPLGSDENNRLVNIFRIIFGVVCIAIAIFWMIFNLRSLKIDVTLFITIAFLMGFGFFQVWSGTGRAIIYIVIGLHHIKLKKNPMLPPVRMAADEIEKIELFPLNVIFYLKTKKKTILRFGTTFHETNEKITDAIIVFAESNNLNLEIIQEEL